MTGEANRGPRWMLPLIIVASLAAIALGTLRYVFVPYKNPSGSMWPTVEVGDYTTSNRTASEPQRGHVVVFRYPENRDQRFSKRVVGLEGDVVEFVATELRINGWSVPRCPIGHGKHKTEEHTSEGELFVEFLDDATYLVFEDRAGGVSSGKWQVKRGEFFVVGDNRNNSHDSRSWFGGHGGGVPNGDAEGRVRLPVVPKLPADLENLRPAFDACLAKRPAKTSPPPAP